MNDDDIQTPGEQQTLVTEAKAAEFRRRAGKNSTFTIDPDAEPSKVVNGYEDLDEKTQNTLNAYIGRIEQWKKNENNFSGNAALVDENLEDRKRLMMELSTSTILDHADLEQYSAYVHADKIAIAKPDPSEQAYENFRKRRNQLRETLKLETFRISKEEYASVAKLIQTEIENESNIEHQRDLIAVRKEVAQENAQNPRFVAELAVDKSQLFDELLVDLDRKDLINEDNKNWLANAQVRGNLFTQELAKRESLKDANSASKTQAFMRMIEIGKEITPNPMAIKTFAMAQDEIAPGLRGKDYELGIAAMENRKFTKEMSLDFFESIQMGAYLDPMDAHLAGDMTSRSARKIANDPVAMFQLANAAFSKQFSEGSAKAGLSFAVMELNAKLIMNDPEAMARLVKADINAAQTVDQFNPTIRQKISENLSGIAFDEMVYKTMETEGSLLTDKNIAVDGYVWNESKEAGEKTKIDLQEILNPKSGNFYAQGDGKGGLIIAASEKDMESGNTFTVNAPITTDIDDEGNEVKKQQFFTALGNTDPVEGKVKIDFGSKGISVTMPDETAKLNVDNANVIPNGKSRHGTPLEAIKHNGPYVEVLHGGYLKLSATEADAEEGRSAIVSLYGINVPGKNAKTKDDSLDAGDAAKEHLEYLLQRYGTKGLGMRTIDGRDGNKELIVTLENGENLSHRMLHDGYALPSDCEHMRHDRENKARLADNNDRGLWAYGFPEDDGKWRMDSLMPHLSRKDKREKLAKTVSNSMATTPLHVNRILSDKSAQLFALEIGQSWEHPNYMREVMNIAHTNPERLNKLYQNNQGLVEELRKKLDKDGNGLTHKEKVAHDRLTLGSRLLGRALIEVGERVDPKTGKVTHKYLTPMKWKKDTEKLISERGIKLPDSMKKFFAESGAAIDQAATKSLAAGKNSLMKLLEAGDSIVR